MLPKREAAAHAEAAAKAEGMIAVLQMEPGLERSESKALSSNLPVKYNFFVHGLPQMQIEDTVRLRRQSGRLLGTCAMTLGQEVGKACVERARMPGRWGDAREWPRQWPHPAVAACA